MPVSLVAMGNPLLDMQVTSGEALLEKYSLKANDAILAEGKQKEIYEDLRKNHEVTYVAGGAAQNAARCAQYVLPEGSTAYFGAVGKDALADQLREANKREGLQDMYMIVDDKPTGACAVVITGHHRSLCTELGASEHFKPAHLEKAEIKATYEQAKFFYLGGFFLTHGLESAKVLAKHAAETGKTFAMNLSAPFIPQFFKSQVDEMLPYVDILIGNETEADAYAASHDFGTKDLQEIAKRLANSDKVNSSVPRTVVLTQGPSSTVVARQGGDVKVYPVQALPDDQIVDTNGAGDAFAGGFMGATVLGRPLDECVETGHKLGQMCVGQVGPKLRFPKEKVL